MDRRVRHDDGGASSADSAVTTSTARPCSSSASARAARPSAVGLASSSSTTSARGFSRLMLRWIMSLPRLLAGVARPSGRFRLHRRGRLLGCEAGREETLDEVAEPPHDRAAQHGVCRRRRSHTRCRGSPPRPRPRSSGTSPRRCRPFFIIRGKAERAMMYGTTLVTTARLTRTPELLAEGGRDRGERHHGLDDPMMTIPAIGAPLPFTLEKKVGISARRRPTSRSGRA